MKSAWIKPNLKGALLFFSALVLFVFTFFINTLAELVRQRLREKYSSI